MPALRWGRVLAFQEALLVLLLLTLVGSFRVERLHPEPFLWREKSSPSVSSCVRASRMSGTRGYRCWPISVWPLPSFAWQEAQWSAKWLRPALITSGAGDTGLRLSREPRRAIRRALNASDASSDDGSALALIPPRSSIAASVPPAARVPAATTVAMIAQARISQ